MGARRAAMRLTGNMERLRLWTLSKKSGLVALAVAVINVLMLCVVCPVNALERMHHQHPGEGALEEAATEADLSAATIISGILEKDVLEFIATGYLSWDLGKEIVASPDQFEIEGIERDARAALVLFTVGDSEERLERSLRTIEASFALDQLQQGVHPYFVAGIVDAKKHYGFARTYGVASFPSLVLFWKPQGQASSPSPTLSIQWELIEDQTLFKSVNLIRMINERIQRSAPLWDVPSNVLLLDMSTYDALVEDPNSHILVVHCCGGTTRDQVSLALESVANKPFYDAPKFALSDDHMLCERLSINPGVLAAIYYGKGGAKKPIIAASVQAEEELSHLISEIMVFLAEEVSAEGKCA
mmetsp:Transcript_17098/g.33480  ORF Transcript_17098/g.33480 Transcript_17098/m.33480 type:complete len:358 (+) Transcript_17098:249-1322(+)